MSILVLDGIIWFLLFVGIGFCGIGVAGLLLFPDIRSRRYTSVRASLIGFGVIFSAILVYGLFRFTFFLGNQYRDLIVLIVILFVIVTVGNVIVSRIIVQRTVLESKCATSLPQKSPGANDLQK